MPAAVGNAWPGRVCAGLSKCLALAFLLSCAGCATPVPPTQLPPGKEGIQQWRAARAQVRSLRQRYEANKPFSMNVALDLTQLQLGQRMRARGTVAVQPPHGLRMVLLGPGGTTALDLWLCRDQYRFAVPAIELERRGDRHTPAAQQRGLPVSFLRWWFLNPMAGRLLSVHKREGLTHFVLKDDAAVVHVKQPVAPLSEVMALTIRRLAQGDEERLQVRGDRCGDVRYRQRSTGLAIEVACEKVNKRPPPARAFADPDDPTRLCGAQDG